MLAVAWSWRCQASASSDPSTPTIRRATAAVLSECYTADVDHENTSDTTLANKQRAGVLFALLVLLGAIALAAATTSGRAIGAFVLPIWLLIPCTLVTAASALYLARALQVTRAAALLTALGALAVGITAGALVNQCQRTCTRSAHVPTPASTQASAQASAPLVLDWAGDSGRAALLSTRPDVARRARADAQAKLAQGVIMFQVPDYYEVWHQALIDVLEGEGVRFSYVSACHMSDTTVVYNHAFNNAMRQALADRHQEPGYVSRISREVHASHGNDGYYEPYIP